MIWILSHGCLHGEVVPYPQNPKHDSFDFHLPYFPSIMSPLKTPMRLSGYGPAINFAKLDVTVTERRCL
jgi:hypothetical protein